MPSFIEKNSTNCCSLIFSIIYIIKSLRNTNIKTVEYTKSIEYLDTNFTKKVYKNGQIIYIKNWINWDDKLAKKYSEKQKWIIVGLEDFDKTYYYEIQPFIENSISNLPKTKIQADRILYYPEENESTDINTFREKYENSLILAVIYLCFLNCIPIIQKNNVRILNTIFQVENLFLKLFQKFININSSYFIDLNFDSTNVLPSINNIIKNIHINILNFFIIENTNVICDAFSNKDLSTKIQSTVINFTSKYKVEFYKKENYNNTQLNTNLSTFFKKYNSNSLPDFPSTFKFKYIKPYGKDSVKESNTINLFNLLCSTFDINSDSMLSVLRYNYDAITDSIYSNLTTPNLNSNIKSNLYSELLVSEKPQNIINQNEIKVGVDGGGKKNKSKRKHNKKNNYNKKNNTKKIYRGGIWGVAAIAAANAGAIAYVAAADAVALIASGAVIATGTGAAIIGGVAVVQVAVAAPVAAVPIGAIAATAIGAAATLTAAPILASIAVITGVGLGLNYMFTGSNNAYTLNVNANQQQEQ